jgi:hypothetical protein
VGGEGWSVSTVVTGGVVVTSPRVEIILNATGAPFIVYPVVGGIGPDGEIEFDFALARCVDPGCIESELATNTGLEFLEATVAIPPDGLPVFAWDNWYLVDDGTEAVAISKCADPDCAELETHEVPASLWFAPVIAVGADGLPVVVYQSTNEPYGPIKMAICADPACVESEIATLDVPEWIAGPFTLTLDLDGLWAVAYPAWNGEFRLARCADPACTEVTVSVFDDTGTDDEGPAKLIFGRDGLPVIAFSAAGEVKLAACHDPACSRATATLLASHVSGWVRSLMVGPDGNPIISYQGDGPEWLAVCETATCEQFRTVQVQGITDGGLLGVVGGADGLPLFVYQTETQPIGDQEAGEMTGNLVVAKCIDPACLEE